MRTLALVLLLAVSGIPVEHQQPQAADPYSLVIVRNAFQRESVGLAFGADMKYIPRLGDACAIAILKIVNSDDLVKPETAGVVAAMIHNAFSYPQIIAIQEDKNPKVSLFLLDYVRDKISAPDVKLHIEQTIAFVEKQKT